MGLKEYKEQKEKKEKKLKRQRQRRLVPMLTAVILIVLIAGTLVYYETRSTPTSTVVNCGVFEYLLTQAETVSGTSTSNVTLTMTTSVTFTTSTTLGHVGRTYSNGTSTTNLNGVVGGVETICRYLPNTSSSSSS